MKKILLLLALLISGSCIQVSAKGNDVSVANYEIKGSKTTASVGNSIINVTVRHKNKNKVTSDMLCKAAIHGILFKGYQADAQSGLTSHRPIAGSPNAETQYSEYFNSFFEDGSYNGYVQCLEDSRRVVKVGNEYKVSCDVVVSEGLLKDDLRKAGILQSMGSGW